MFENCSTMDELNQARVAAVRSGEHPVRVNQAYARRKALILGGGSREFKNVSFIPIPLPHPETVNGVDFAYVEEGKPYTIHVNTALM